ncbi:MAG TPA: hypothetical protein PK977_18305, partial [Chitinophagaceae bacterium]|nr:hypothetical protein [Chitinophagaceae bacterium]
TDWFELLTEGVEFVTASLEMLTDGFELYENVLVMGNSLFSCLISSLRSCSSRRITSVRKAGML